jgi:cysteine synthase
MLARRALESTQMRHTVGNVLAGIGNTPLVDISEMTSPGSARLLIKLEWANPTGSMKDRMARAAIEAAEASGRLRPGGTVVEYTAGTTGISLAFICAAKGYGIEIVFSDAFSDEKRRTMEAFGARITDVKSDHKRITEALIKEMIRTAGELSARPGHWWCDQLNNHDAVRGYRPLGEEIWTQTGGEVTAFVHAVSTAHSIHGVTEALWERNSRIEITAVEPDESAVLSGGKSGSHKIEGIGIGFVPPLWLASERGVFAGTSTGANVVAARRVAERLGPSATVVTIACDSGLRYLSTDVFRRSEMSVTGG